MTEHACASTLYGSTSKAGSIPNARCAGPVLSDDGRLVISESFCLLTPIADMAKFDRGLAKLLAGDDYVESWGIWDCCRQRWAEVDVSLHRFEGYDLVIRQEPQGVCVWRGAIDQHERVLASLDPDECQLRVWQWARVGRLSA